MNAVFKAIVGVAISATVMSSAYAGALIDKYTLKLPGMDSMPAQTVINIGALGFNGESYVNNTFLDPLNKDQFTFQDNGIFNVTTKNGGASLLNFGQLTLDYRNGVGTGSLSGGSITFGAGGTLDVYYSPTKAYADVDNGATVANRFGATTGMKIATFTQLAGGGGFINPDGTPSSNGNLTLLGGRGEGGGASSGGGYSDYEDSYGGGASEPARGAGPKATSNAPAQTFDLDDEIPF